MGDQQAGMEAGAQGTAASAFAFAAWRLDRLVRAVAGCQP